MPKVTTQSRLAAKRKEYADKYDIEDLSSGNDKSNLEMLLHYEVTVETMQEELRDLLDTVKEDKDALGKINAINKSLDAIVESKLRLEKALNIDRATRKKEVNDQSPAEYIKSQKIAAKEFLEQRLIRVYCEDCRVLVMRFSPVHDHTKFSVECKCSQCGKMVRARREDKDIMFDLAPKDKEWRKKFPVEIVQGKTDTTDDIDSVEDDVILGET